MKRRGEEEEKRKRRGKAVERKRRRRGKEEKKRKGGEEEVAHLHTPQQIITRALRLSFSLLPSPFSLLLSGNAGFDVPRTFAFCEDNDVIGTPFYLMDFVKGGEDKGEMGEGRGGRGETLATRSAYPLCVFVCPCVHVCPNTIIT